MSQGKSAAHTPGPWHYQEESDAYTHIARGPNGEFLFSGPQDTSGETEANIRLGAAALTMLEALKAIVESAHNGNEPGQTWIMVAGGLIDSAEAAIKSAEGESQ